MEALVARQMVTHSLSTLGRYAQAHKFGLPALEGFDGEQHRRHGVLPAPGIDLALWVRQVMVRPALHLGLLERGEGAC
jgi:hypothetical protein